MGAVLRLSGRFVVGSLLSTSCGCCAGLVGHSGRLAFRVGAVSPYRGVFVRERRGLRLSPSVVMHLVADETQVLSYVRCPEETELIIAVSLLICARSAGASFCCLPAPVLAKNCMGFAPRRAFRHGLFPYSTRVTVKNVCVVETWPLEKAHRNLDVRPGRAG